MITARTALNRAVACVYAECVKKMGVGKIGVPAGVGPRLSLKEGIGRVRKRTLLPE